MFFLLVRMSNMTPPEAFIIPIPNVNPLAEFLTSDGSLIYEDPLNNLYLTMFMWLVGYLRICGHL